MGTYPSRRGENIVWGEQKEDACEGDGGEFHSELDGWTRWFDEGLDASGSGVET
jgi:hypothetical protein